MRAWSDIYDKSIFKKKGLIYSVISSFRVDSHRNDRKVGTLEVRMEYEKKVSKVKYPKYLSCAFFSKFDENLILASLYYLNLRKENSLLGDFSVIVVKQLLNVCGIIQKTIN